MRPSSFLSNQKTKWAGVDASAFSDSSSPWRMAKSSLIWTVPRLIARLIPARQIVSGAELHPVSLRGVNHALHHADDSVAATTSLRRLPGGRVRCPALQPRPGTVNPLTRSLAQRRFATRKCSGLQNTLPVRRVNCPDSPFAGTDLLAFFAYPIARDRR